ncbi:hypothetical protein RP20_CCG028410 [Aedes albopictus]|nr:hypothetical protein RP20_CCG028410 [Aedes albopictus]
MKLLQVVLVLLFVAFITAKVPPKRQSSLNVLAQVQSVIPSKRSRSSEQSAADVLNSFYRSVLTAQFEAVQKVSDTEAEFSAFGETVDYWCWENNVSLLEGTIRWVGVGYSNCLAKLDTSVAEILSEVYSRSHDEKVDLSKYSVFGLFRKKNVISNPEAIQKAIVSINFGITKVIPELNGVLPGLEAKLNEKLTNYSGCLTQKFSSAKVTLDSMLSSAKVCAESY